MYEVGSVGVRGDSAWVVEVLVEYARWLDRQRGLASVVTGAVVLVLGALVYGLRHVIIRRSTDSR